MSLKNYLKIGIFSSLFLTFWLVGGIVFITRATDFANDALTTRNENTAAVANLESTSSYLTNEARLYTYTNDLTHFENYNEKLAEDLFTKAKTELLALGVPSDITGHLDTIQNSSLLMAEQEQQAFKLMAAGNAEAAQQLLAAAQYKANSAQIYTQYDTFKQQVEEWSLAEAANGKRATTVAITVVSSLILIFIISAIAILVLINRKVKPLFALTENAEQIALGDLTVQEVPVKTNDEIGKLTVAFNTMVDKLRSILTTVKASSIDVAASSEELLANSEQTANISKQVATNIHDISTKSTQQQLQMDENAVALNEMTIGIQQVAAASEDVANAANEAKSRALFGQDSLASTTMQMQDIKQAVDDTITAINELSTQSKAIEEFVTAITDISAQTNLLALNAAIEAARAGEAGKGFAVVANEVRNLAEQSNSSANRITAIIQTLQTKVQETTTYMEKVTTRVENGVAAVQATGRSFEGITQSTNTVSDQITGVLAIAEQMAASAEQISAIFDNLQMLSKDTSTDSETSVAFVKQQHEAIQEITASSAMLSTLAETLNNEVAKFKL